MLTGFTSLRFLDEGFWFPNSFSSFIISRLGQLQTLTPNERLPNISPLKIKDFYCVHIY